MIDSAKGEICVAPGHVASPAATFFCDFGAAKRSTASRMDFEIFGDVNGSRDDYGADERVHQNSLVVLVFARDEVLPSNRRRFRLATNEMMVIMQYIMNINGSVALVTGANRGLGLAFAKALLERGAKKVYAAARDPKSVTLSGVVPIPLDVTDPSSVAKLAELAPDVTLLINNAGISKGKGLLNPDALQLARQEMETNYFGPLAVSSALGPTLAKNGGGAIVNVLSVLSWVVLSNSATYSASKAAAWALTNALRHEFGAQGTQVVALHAAFIDTDMAATIKAPKAKPEDVVKNALDTLEAGGFETLADDISKSVKTNLSNGVYLRAVG